METALVYIILNFVIKLTFCMPKSPLRQEWDEYKEIYKKCYTPTEDSFRSSIYFSRKEKIDCHNNEYLVGKQTYEQGINEFTDWTEEEMGYLCAFRSQQIYSDDSLMDTPAPNLFNIPAANLGNMTTKMPGKRDVFARALPLGVDWRTSGHVSPVLNQGRCGCCYAFSATGSLEGQWKKVKGTLPQLSQQQIVDCSSSITSNDGCDGGSMPQSFYYIKKIGGITSSTLYPYTSEKATKAGTCKFSNVTTPVTAKVSSYVRVAQSDDALRTAIASVGPISVALCSGTSDFMNYKRGIFNNNACKKVDHAVLAVGFNSTCWIIKNSWGTSWGVDGYMCLNISIPNIRGINVDTSYPIVV